MRLLVSVQSAAEAVVAVAGGADVIDAKDPGNGALGAVSSLTMCEICAAVAGARPVTAALGDADDERAIEGSAHTFAAHGATFVKVGFAGIVDAARVASLLTRAVRGARAGNVSTGVIAVTYADVDRAIGRGLGIRNSGFGTRDSGFGDLVDIAADAGAAGVLIDTADKQGPGLRMLVEPRVLAAWVAKAHHRGLLMALAGKLTAGDLPFVCDAGADIAGVRGAACEGGRIGTVTTDRVRQLGALCASASTAQSDRLSNF